MAKAEENAATAQTLAQRVAEIVWPTIADLGFETVRVECLGQKGARVQIMVERADGEAMTLDDCARVSQAVSPLLDVEEVIPGAYTLEVSSPGIDRPLVRLADFDRFAGFEAKIELARPLDGQRRFRGRLRGTDGDMVRFDGAEGPVAVPYVDIRRAKLVLTDELIRASRGKSQRDLS
jgi:ribosome maturation factor RimP